MNAASSRSPARAAPAVIRPLTPDEYHSWVEQVIPAYAKDKVDSGAWDATEALEKSRREYDNLLPDGPDTKDNHLLAVLAEDGTRVGMLWFAVEDRGKARIAYVFNLEVLPEHRRKGHAQRALAALEGEVQRLGLAGIALHVFGHNTAAQALYTKLGFVPTNINMYKSVLGAARAPRTGSSEEPPMSDMTKPLAILAADAPLRTKASSYPEPFASRMAGREKRPLGDLFGLANFGVNLTRLRPGSSSALRHAHSKQDEFVYVLQGTPTLVTDEGSTELAPGMCTGFRAGSGNGHCLKNETDEDVIVLEVGDRTPGDEGSYPDDDLKALMVDGRWRFVHKDGTPYA